MTALELSDVELHTVDLALSVLASITPIDGLGEVDDGRHLKFPYNEYEYDRSTLEPLRERVRDSVLISE